MSPLETLPERVALAPGVDLLLLPEPRFKRALLQVDFDLPLDAGTSARTLLAQVLEQGSARHPGRMQLAQRLEELYGATVQLGGMRAAERHRMRLQVSWVGDRFLPADVRVEVPVVGLARELLEEPLRGDDGAPFQADVLTRERAQLVRQIRSFVDDRAGYARQRFLEAMCAGEPFARPPWGTAEEAEALTGHDLESARLELLRHARVTVTAVGPVEAAPLTEALRAWLGAEGPWGADRWQPTEPESVRPGALRHVREELPVDQARFHLGFRVPRPHDGPAMEALLTANSVLGGGIHGRLFRIVREERSLAYGISSEILAGKGLLAVGAGIHADAAAGVEEEVLAQVADLAAHGPTDEELAKSRAAFLNGLQSIGDAPESLARFHAREFRFDLNRTPAERIAQVAAVRPEDIRDAAAQWQADLVYLLAAPAAAPQPAPTA